MPLHEESPRVIMRAQGCIELIVFRDLQAVGKPIAFGPSSFLT